jgi:hypothetical protein
MNQAIAQAQESAMGANGVPKGIIILYHGRSSAADA